jgi:hypothetical protein
MAIFFSALPFLTQKKHRRWKGFLESRKLGVWKIEDVWIPAYNVHDGRMKDLGNGERCPVGT